MSKMLVNNEMIYENSLAVKSNIQSVEFLTWSHRYKVPEKVLKDRERFSVKIPKIKENLTVGFSIDGTVSISVYEDGLDKLYRSVGYIFDTDTEKYIPAIDATHTTIHDILYMARDTNNDYGKGKPCFKTVWNKHKETVTCCFRCKLGGKVSGNISCEDRPDKTYRTIFDKAGFGIKIVEVADDGVRSIIYTNDISRIMASQWANKLRLAKIRHDIYVNNGNGTFYLLKNPKVDLFFIGLD